MNALLWHCKGSLSGIGGEIRPGIVHRIDKDTSGLLVVAKDDATHIGLSQQMAVHSVERAYQTVVYGGFAQDEGFVEANLGRSKTDRKKMAVYPASEPHTKYAYTGYKVLERFGGFTLLECRLKTGRTHQIRVHMASIQHPVAGDPVYGPHNCITKLHGQCLHAKTLGSSTPSRGNISASTRSCRSISPTLLHRSGGGLYDETSRFYARTLRSGPSPFGRRRQHAAGRAGCAPAVFQPGRQADGLQPAFAPGRPRRAGGLRLAAPALTCGGTLAYRFSEGSGQPLCSFAGCEESIFKKLPAAVGLGIALQMADGSTRVLRMSTALERHLRREFTPFTLCSPADVKGEDVLRILLYQDRQQLPIQALLEKALGDNAAMLRSERTGMDVMVLTPGAVSAEAMLGAVCLPVNCTADQLTVAAGCSQMLELVRQAKQSVVPADAPVELRLAASQTTLTDHDTGAAAEFFYGLVRSAEAAS